ncbi:DUF3127 domain-containing protein [Prosthecochloris sp. HL-130-GSB]|jgi:hypothetical protein|uniref:DUF3127 domain-containing protein n=1 Tax=Prosthecochloris sp. HL-130-GSB TaxID=1974213 RepID=UPI000A1C0408|nr:DUF3127 domain-containing protein [Prosthecochloris sp. HL-130-GSB]ARM31106.1 hypothetical protein B9H02_07105 [Prosthecochloris sp. HL-130-GSB]
MDVTGRIIEILPPKTGAGKNGTWKKQEVILETDGQYPKKICFSFWGDKADNNLLQNGNSVKISFNLESREFNGKWYTEAKGWRVEPADNNQQEPPAEYTAEYGGSPVPPSGPDDLPF